MSGNDIIKGLPDGGTVYGARMGRRDVTTDPAATVRLFRVHFEDGDYDAGGAYWGGSGLPLFCAHADGFTVFRRAPDRAAAQAKLSAEFPDLKFARKSKVPS